MRWHDLAGLKFYAAAGLALVGVSAASTLLVENNTLAQQPAQTAKGEDEETLAELESILSEKLVDDHPQLREVRKRLQALRERKARGKSDEVTRYRVEAAPFNATQVVTEEGQVLTEDVRGNQTVVLRRTAEGNLVQDVTTAPAEVRWLSLLDKPTQDNELQTALQKFKSKEISETDKAAAKEKISAILSEQFDEDMARRSKQIADLEKKVATLKEQTEKRKTAKNRIIDLRIEVLVNEMEGLGFPGGPTAPFVPAMAPAEVRTIRRPGASAGVIPPLPPIAVPPVAPTPPKLPAGDQ